MTLAGWLSLYGTVAAMLLPVFACAGVGAVWGLRKLEYPGHFVSVLATTVSTPALVFHTLVTTRLDNAQLLQIGGAVIAGLLVAIVLGVIGLRLAGLPPRALGPTVTFSNVGNLGLPVAQLAFGDSGLAVAVAFFAVASVIQHTIGVSVLQGAGGKSRSWPRGVALACLGAIAVRASGVALAPPLLESVRLIGSLAVPLMLLSLGYALVTVERSGLRRGAMVGVIRVVVGLATGWIVTSLIPLPPLVGQVLALQFAMPAAVVSYLYADRYTDYGDVAAGGVLVSTALFVVLSPLLFWLAGAAGA
jgi:predicted permease